MANNNQIYKMSNAGGFKSLNRYHDMLAGNTTWNPWSPDGAFDALATVTVPAGGVSSITFAGIPNTYKHLQVRALGRTNRADLLDFFEFRFNGDSGNNYTRHHLNGNGSSASSFGEASRGSALNIYSAGGNQASGVFAAGIFDILDYSATNKYKTMRALVGLDGNGSGEITLMSNLWMNNSAITSMSITPISGNVFVQHSQFTLYGVK